MLAEFVGQPVASMTAEGLFAVKDGTMSRLDYEELVWNSVHYWRLKLLLVKYWHVLRFYRLYSDHFTDTLE